MLECARGSNEMPGYHTGPMCYVGYITGSRHSHLDNAGYSLDQQILNEGKVPNLKKSVEKRFMEEIWRQILSSLVVCFFSRRIYERDVVLKALEVSGIELGGKDLDSIGLEILRNKFKFKLREGFNPEKASVPSRVFQTDTPLGKIDEEYSMKSIEHYIELINRPRELIG